jgi:hypothetical protein
MGSNYVTIVLIIKHCWEDKTILLLPVLGQPTEPQGGMSGEVILLSEHIATDVVYQTPTREYTVMG